MLFDTYSNYKHHYFFIGSAKVTSWLVLRAFEWVLISSATPAKVSTYKNNNIIIMSPDLAIYISWVHDCTPDTCTFNL